MSVFASFDDIIDKNPANNLTVEFNRINSLTIINNQEIIFILADAHRYSDQDGYKLVRVSKNSETEKGTVKYVSLGDWNARVSLVLDADNTVYVQQNDKVTAFDITNNRLEELVTKEFVSERKMNIPNFIRKV